MRTKVFICFASQDRTLATRLYADLTADGADVFQFMETAQPGTDAWTQVLDAIKTCDLFIALLSQAALDSRAVEHEINNAHYYNVNQGTPSLVPALVEDVEKPAKLAIYTELPLADYDAGLAGLRDLVRACATCTDPEDLEPTSTATAGEPQLTTMLTPEPVTVSGREKVTWLATIRNDGPCLIHDIVARLSRTPFAAGFALEPGASKRFRQETIFAEPGQRTRTLTATGRTDNGTEVVSRVRAAVTVRPPPAGSNTVSRLLGDRTSAGAGAARLDLPEGQFRRQFAGEQSSWENNAWIWVPVVLALGALVTLNAWWLGPWLLVQITGRLPESAAGWLASVGQLPYVDKALLFIAPLLIGYIAVDWFEDGIAPLEGPEFVLMTALAVLAAFVLAYLPALLMTGSVDAARVDVVFPLAVGFASVYAAFVTLVDI